MNIEIKNFGPIEYLNIDLDKDLHLIYGKNAIGKSYAISCLYCLLKNIDRLEGFSIQENSESVIKTKRFIIDELKSDFRNPFRLFHVVFAVYLKILLIEPFQNSLKNTFSAMTNLNNKNNNQLFEITVVPSQPSICNKITFLLSESDELDMQASFDDKGLKRYVATVNKLLGLDSETQWTTDILDKYGERLIILFVGEMLSIFKEFTDKVKEIHFLPASRSGLYQGLNSLSPIIAELSQNRSFVSNNSIKLPTLPEPVSDYFLDITTLNKKNVNEKFVEFVSLLESKILKGKIEINEKTRNISYIPQNLGVELNLSEASSMVSELSPLVLYLKHIINYKKSDNNFIDKALENYNFSKGNGTFSNEYCFLFIEEPEAHLHPEIQVELMKIFANLTQHNLKIFITSHSNYMFNELNNLILENKIDKEKIAIYHLIQSENGTIQNPEMTVTEDGIYDENFQETSEKLYEERMRILEEANAN